MLEQSYRKVALMGCERSHNSAPERPVVLLFAAAGSEMFALIRNLRRRIACWQLIRRMKSIEERYQGCYFRRIQVLAIGGHVAAALNHLPDQLWFRQPIGHIVKRRSARAAQAAERVTVAALLVLKHDCSL